MIRPPPGPPTTMNSLPSFVRMLGVMDDNGRLPGWIAFASPCTRPNIFGSPWLRGEIVHFVVQQKSKSRSRNPASVAAIQCVRKATAFPALSTMEK